MARKRTKGTGRTPVMEQFFQAKSQYPDALLFFRMGDFYELFHEDAVVASKALDIALTARSKSKDGERIPMAGVPHHAAAGYLAKLLDKGFRVAICEQLADPSTVKGIVPRGVVRVATPALTLEPDSLDARSDNYLVSIGGQGPYGLAAFEMSRSHLMACELSDQAHLIAELVRLEPRELLLPPALASLEATLRNLLPRTSFRNTAADTADGQQLATFLSADVAEEASKELSACSIEAALRTLRYAQDAHPGTQLKVQRIEPYGMGDQLVLDEVAVRNLELCRTLSGERKGSVLDLLDCTKTPMGARLLRRRILAPLTCLSSIRRRHDAVEALVRDPGLRDALRAQLRSVGDLERLSTRVEASVAHPRDLGAIRTALVAVQECASLFRGRAGRSTDDTLGKLEPDDLAEDILDLLETGLLPELPTSHLQGQVIAAEVDADLDELRTLSSTSKDVLLQLESRERKRTGIHSLKIKYTRVFGYYIEVTRANLHLVPEDYQRKQTIANGERFITEELSDLQSKILGADERIRALEAELFVDLRGRVARDAHRLRQLASRLAALDVHAALAETAHRFDYVRPLMNEEERLDLSECRHPIVERLAEAGTFVPNDTLLDVDEQRFMIITGPNMSGKSTAMRQVALAVIMAQAGCFVPARAATIGLVDRVFTRVGASDNLGAGQSTFMVEMQETATILREATRRSLVILDEIGRGTSTYDGLAIAWAVAEHLHDVIGCRAMFATHYHELCEFSELRSTAVSYNVAAREYGEEVVFLRRLVEGATNRSYGVAVARLAGVSEIVLARARTILADLETGSPLPGGRASPLRGRAQLDLFDGGAATATAPGPRERSEVERTLAEIDLERLRPIDALLTLQRLQEMQS